MDTNKINLGMRVFCNKTHPKIKSGEAGTISQKRMINDIVMFEVNFDNGLKLYMKPEYLDQENISKEEILSIEKKTYTQSERAVMLAKRVVQEKRLLERANTIDQLEKDLKKRIEDLKSEKKDILTKARKIEEAARRLTKIKALGDSAIVTQIHEMLEK